MLTTRFRHLRTLHQIRYSMVKGASTPNLDAESLKQTGCELGAGAPVFELHRTTAATACPLVDCARFCAITPRPPARWRLALQGPASAASRS
jgi:hypothetical protein